MNQNTKDRAEKLLLSSQEAARVLGISTRHLYVLRMERGLPHVRLGEKLAYPVDALREWIALHTERNGSTGDAGEVQE